MRKFEELDKRLASTVEADTLKRWGGVESIYKETLDNRAKAKKFVFYDGPATANGLPVIRYTKSIFSNFLLNQGITG